MFDWDDLRHFLAVARSGSTTAAARLLEVDQSTVQRRLAELERRIGQPLAERHPTGYRLTAFGEQLLPHAWLGWLCHHTPIPCCVTSPPSWLPASLCGELGMELVLDLPFKSDTTDAQIDEMAGRIGASNAQVVLNHGSPAMYERLIRKAQARAAPARAGVLLRQPGGIPHGEGIGDGVAAGGAEPDTRGIRAQPARGRRA